MTKSTEIVKLAKGGMRPFQIAKHLDVTRGYVSTVLSQARKRGEQIRSFRDDPGLYVPMTPLLHRALRKEAYSRGMTPGELVGQLSQICVTDQMFGAILDD